MKKTILVLVSSLLILSCSLKDDNRTEGTVVFNNIEGGFYGIILNNNMKLQPLNLDEEYNVDSLKLKFNYTEHHAVESIYMWGQPVELSNVETID